MPSIRACPTLGLRIQIVLLAALLLSGAGLVFGTQRHIVPKNAAKPEAVAPQPTPPPPPPSPQTLAQMPASPPQVTYDKGALTIVARNSTLADILLAVHAKTGAVMDISGSATERVVSRFGPGSPRDVLAQLLNGSSFNYAILGSAGDAGTVQKVVLSPRSSSDTEANAVAPPTAAEPNPFPRVQPPVAAQASQDMSDDDSEDANDSDATDQPAATPAPGSEAQPNPNQPAIKTPEQLLQELQRQQQQQQAQPAGGEPQGNPRQQ
jgi:hypothetical protein